MEPLNDTDKNVPIRALRSKTMSLISALLNPIMVIPSDNGVLRYWRGLLGLCDINPTYEASIQEDSDPTKKVLNLWSEKDSDGSTIGKFLLFLENMDRFDVIEDIRELICEDIDIFKSKPFDVQIPNLEADKYIITTEDVSRISEGQSLENYDAFVLYGDEDIHFATQLIETMEKDYGMRFCVKDRDLVGGGLEYNKMIKLITERCNRLIVILSDSFFKSSANNYYLSFAQAYGIESERKVIPCVYKQCTLPKDMRCISILDYRRASLWDFWGKLRDTIRVPNNEKCLLNRSKSDSSHTLVKQDKFPSLKPDPIVKFNSIQNLNSLEEDVITSHLNASTSADNLKAFPVTDNNKKVKKINWLQKILKKNNVKTAENNVQPPKEKKKSFYRHVKRKAAAVAS